MWGTRHDDGYAATGFRAAGFRAGFVAGAGTVAAGMAMSNRDGPYAVIGVFGPCGIDGSPCPLRLYSPRTPRMIAIPSRTFTGPGVPMRPLTANTRPTAPGNSHAHTNNNWQSSNCHVALATNDAFWNAVTRIPVYRPTLRVAVVYVPTLRLTSAMMDAGVTVRANLTIAFNAANPAVFRAVDVFVSFRFAMMRIRVPVRVGCVSVAPTPNQHGHHTKKVLARQPQNVVFCKFPKCFFVPNRVP